MDTIEINSALPDGSHLFDADVHVLKEHLKSNQMSQKKLDGYLLSGFQLVQRQIREMRQVAPALKLLLQSGSKWKNNAVLGNYMTPYQLICQATGDEVELLDLIINSSERDLLNSVSYEGSTALLYAVNNANLKCVKSLIANGAKVNFEGSSCLECTKQNSMRTLNLITAANKLLQHDSIYPSGIMSDIFDLLLDSGFDVNKPCRILHCKRTPIICALTIGNVQCAKKMIEHGARLDLIINGHPLWAWIAFMGNVDLLKCMLDHGGIYKNSTYRIFTTSRSMLSVVVKSGKVVAIHHLLELGVEMPSYARATYNTLCKECGKNRILIDLEADCKAMDPFMIACRQNMCNVVQLLDKYGNQNLKTMNALFCAVRNKSVEVVEYLLSRYKYPLNDEYLLKDRENGIRVGHLLTVACGYHPAVVQLLLDHGADFNKTYCYTSGIINSTMYHESEEIIALLIRNGADLNCRSFALPHSIKVFPFENAVATNRRYMAEMLLMSGCSGGVPSTDKDHKFKKYMEPDLQKLMKEWNVHDNNVTPLEKQCRWVILKQLSPAAQKKIKKLPLPPPIIKYLSIPELDDIIDAKRKKQLNDADV